MRLRIHQLSLRLDYDKSEIVGAAARALGCNVEELGRPTVLRRSIDARNRDLPPRFVLTIEIDYVGENGPALVPGRIDQAPEPMPSPPRPKVKPSSQPIVVGAGPSGLLAALTLAEAGARPLLIERGQTVAVRAHHVDTFWEDGILNPESNVLFGEGGAGLFSDGKLTTRSKERGAVRKLLETLVQFGASPDILFDAEPHIGSDMLTHVIPALRERIEDLGGMVRFGSRLDRLHVEGDRVRGLTVGSEEIRTDVCFLGAGHSARDLYRSLASSGVPLAPKAFAVGVRIEMPQSRINVAQYGRWASHPRLGPASFRLTRKAGKAARATYTFCNCPGGIVMSCASHAGHLTTNGMSLSRRASPFGNAAVLVPVDEADVKALGQDDPLAGITYQASLEAAAFQAGGSDYALPAQSLADFLDQRRPTGIPDRRSCARAVAADLSPLLPPPVLETLRTNLPRMLRELNGIRVEDVLLYGVETRSSSPIRILRDPGSGETVGLRGVFPIGEGAGYAGGIVSSALDGMHAAERWLHRLH